MEKCVNGVNVPMTSQEAAIVQAEWDANTNKTPVQLDAERTQRATRELSADKVRRVLFEALFDLENRMRVQESRPAVTRVQYRNALIDIWKTL